MIQALFQVTAARATVQVRETAVAHAVKLEAPRADQVRARDGRSRAAPPGARARSPAPGSSSSRRNRRRTWRPSPSTGPSGSWPRSADARCARRPTRPSGSSSRSRPGPCWASSSRPAVAAFVAARGAPPRHRHADVPDRPVLSPARRLARAPGRPPHADPLAPGPRPREPPRRPARAGSSPTGRSPSRLGYLSHLLVDAANPPGVAAASTRARCAPSSRGARPSGPPRARAGRRSSAPASSSASPCSGRSTRSASRASLHVLTRTTAGAIADFRRWEGTREVWADLDGHFRLSQRRVHRRVRILGIENVSTLIVLDPATGHDPHGRPERDRERLPLRDRRAAGRGRDRRDPPGDPHPAPPPRAPARGSAGRRDVLPRDRPHAGRGGPQARPRGLRGR